MLTENRKRRCDSDGEQLNPRAKRSGGGQEANVLGSDVGRDAWDSESSSSDSSNGISSPEIAAGTSTSLCAPNTQKDLNRHSSLSHLLHDSSGDSLGLHGDASYDHINRLLREAHFSSLQTRGQPGSAT